MGEFNIYNEILDFSDFIHLFLNKGKENYLRKKRVFLQGRREFPFVAYLRKVHSDTPVMIPMEKSIFCLMHLRTKFSAIIRLCRIIVTQFLIYKLFKVPSYIHFLYLR